MARENELWQTGVGGTYIETISPTGYDVLINGSNKYLNFNTTVGSSGYGIRDNAGRMEFKHSGGAWAELGSGGGGGAFTDLTDVPSSYTGQALKAVRVNAGETALEFFTISGGGDAFTSAPLSQFAATTSAQLRGVMSDETGTGVLVFNDAPTFATSITGSYLTASEMLITNGSKQIVSAPVATYPSLTELTYLKGATSAVQTQLNAKLASTFTLAQLNTAVTDADIARTDAGNTFTGSSTASGWVLTSTRIASGSFIGDVNGDNVFTFTSGGASRVNWFQVDNAIAGSNPILQAIGSSTDIGINLTPKGAGKVVVSTALTVADEVYGAGWNGSLEVPTKNAIYDKIESMGGGGSGDFVGPASATDNAIVRFDTTTGKLGQDSGVIIDDTNNITGVVNLTATSTITADSATTATIKSDRGATTSFASLLLTTAGTDRWGFQMRNDSTNDLHIRDVANGVDIISATSGATPAVTAGGNWTFSSSVALGSNSLTLTGSIGATGARATKLWATDGEFTNMPTVGGTSLSSTFQPLDTQLTSVAGLSYTGNAGKFMRVNAGETDFELVTISGGGDALTSNPLSQFAATTSLQLKGVISDETGSGALVFADTPTLVTPVLGVATATSINKVAITAPATSATLTIADGKTLTASNTITFTATDGSTLAIGAGGTLGSAAYTASSAYEVPLTFSTGLTRTTNTITVNTSQNIATLSNLTSNGFVKTSGGTGALSIDTNTYLTTASAASTYQPLDSDLTTIAGLTATTDNIIQSVGSAWASRTPTQVTATLINFVGDSGSGGTKGLVPAPSAGDSGKYLKGDGTWATVSGSGDVVGPASSTDNAVVRFDSTTGKLLQNSTVIIGDTGAIATTIANTSNVIGLTVTQNDTTNNVAAVKIISAVTQDAITGLEEQLCLEGTSAGTHGPFVAYYHNSASPTTGDVMGQNFYFNNASASKVYAGGFSVAVGVTTAGSESSDIYFRTLLAGTNAVRMDIGYDGNADINGVAVGASTASGILTSNGSQDLILRTGNPTTGSITIADGANGIISLTPNGTGAVAIGGTLELGHATDSTISRVSAGVLAIEGVNILTTATGLPLAGGTMTGSITLAENAGIALDPAGSADGKWTGITIAATAGYVQSFGDLVYLDPTDSRWEKCDANSASGADGDSRGIIGIVVSAGASDGSACTILLHGVIRADAAFPTFTVNNPIYVSETAGAVTQTQPTTTDVVIRIVGFALTADEMYFNPENDYITHT